ncbi:MAG: hypothetical protein P4M04_00170 [Acidobacteriota bacterium]|nr:hypothetical protein [Acidobacteriota bacterium]
MMDRVYQGFLDSGLPEPFIRFNFGDGLIGGGVSSVGRVLKRHPELARFVTEAAPMPGIAGARRISNGPVSPGAGQVVPYVTLQAIAAGVPRSFPFHSVAIHFHSPEFGEVMPTPTHAAEMMSGVLLTDSWWVNGRNRSLSACMVVEVQPGDKKLPSPSGPVAKVFAACGKAKKTVQAPLAGELGPGPVPAVRLPTGTNIASANPELAVAVKAIAVKYRDRLPEIVKQVGLPHDLPDPSEMRRFALGVTAGPKKPALERVFKPMGYTCQGGTGASTGTFNLRRRTATNLTLQLTLDCGTWSHSLLAMFRVWGLGFKATLFLPPTAKAVFGAQYPIGDAEQWQKIVENLGTLVAELERTLVPEIEAVTGASPEWYKPES